MTGKPEQVPTYFDLEPMLYNLKHSIRLMTVMLEKALNDPDSNIDADDSEAIFHAAYNVRAHADETLEHWIEAQAADSRKTAA